jgi:hypothetical protein
LLTAEPGQYPNDPTLEVNDDTLVKKERGRTSVSEKNGGQQIEEEVEVLIPQQVSDRDEYVEFASKYDDTCQDPQGGNLITLAKGKEGRIVDNCGATEHERNEDCRINMNVATNKEILCFTTTSSKTDDVKKQPGARHKTNDD